MLIIDDLKHLPLHRYHIRPISAASATGLILGEELRCCLLKQDTLDALIIISGSELREDLDLQCDMEPGCPVLLVQCDRESAGEGIAIGELRFWLLLPAEPGAGALQIADWSETVNPLTAVINLKLIPGEKYYQRSGRWLKKVVQCRWPGTVGEFVRHAVERCVAIGHTIHPQTLLAVLEGGQVELTLDVYPVLASILRVNPGHLLPPAIDDDLGLNTYEVD